MSTTSSPLTLYHFAPSAHSRAVLWTLRFLDIDVTVQNVNLFEKEQLGAAYVAINPQHCVPTLKDGAFTMWESRAIATYVAETRRPESEAWPLHDVQLRARIQQRLQFDLGTLYARIRAICFPIIYLGVTTISAEHRASLTEAFGFLEAFLGAGDYLAGTAHPTLADIFAMASVSSIVHVGLDLAAWPRTAAWYERCSKLPGFAENDEGAKQFADRVRSKLTEKF